MRPIRTIRKLFGYWFHHLAYQGEARIDRFYDWYMDRFVDGRRGAREHPDHGVRH